MIRARRQNHLRMWFVLTPVLAIVLTAAWRYRSVEPLAEWPERLPQLQEPQMHRWQELDFQIGHLADAWYVETRRTQAQGDLLLYWQPESLAALGPQAEFLGAVPVGRNQLPLNHTSGWLVLFNHLKGQIEFQVQIQGGEQP